MPECLLVPEIFDRYTQAGILLPNKTNDKLKLQPYVAYTFKRLDANDDAGHYFLTSAVIFSWMHTMPSLRRNTAAGRFTLM